MHVIDNTHGADTGDVIESTPKPKRIEFKALHAFEDLVIRLTAYASTDVDQVEIETTITHTVESVDFAIENECRLRVKTLVIERGDEDLYVMTKDIEVRRALMRCQELAAHLFKIGLVMTYYPTPTQPTPTTVSGLVSTAAGEAALSTPTPNPTDVGAA